MAGRASTTTRKTTASRTLAPATKRTANTNKRSNTVSALDKIVNTAKSSLKNTFSSQEGVIDTQLEKLFLDSLKDIYWAEKNLLKALQKMKKSATSTKLQSAFQTHYNQTETHISRLDQVFGLLGVTPRAKKCEAMQGLIAEGETIIGETEEGTATRDVGLILAAQKVEHYEIATYGGLAQLAGIIGQDKAAKLLHQTLEEEKKTDLLLTQIAENNINYQARSEKD